MNISTQDSAAARYNQAVTFYIHLYAMSEVMNYPNVYDIHYTLPLPTFSITMVIFSPLKWGGEIYDRR